MAAGSQMRCRTIGAAGRLELTGPLKMSCCGAGLRWGSLTVLLQAVSDQCFQWLLPPPLSHVEGPQRCHLPPGRRPATQRAPIRRPSWLAQEQGLPVGAWRGDQPQCWSYLGHGLCLKCIKLHKIVVAAVWPSKSRRSWTGQR